MQQGFEATQEFVNKYIDRQQRMISDLTSKVVMLETQLSLAAEKLAKLEAEQKMETRDDGFATSEITKTEE